MVFRQSFIGKTITIKVYTVYTDRVAGLSCNSLFQIDPQRQHSKKVWQACKA
jgi:hypothetical protein